jgi:hypothetical protein
MNEHQINPLVRLYKYRPTINKSPRENYLNESFAICLLYNPSIVKAFLQNFVDIKNTEEHFISTQVKSKDGRTIFDLLITDNKSFFVVIESKLGARIGKSKTSDLDQIDKYVVNIKEQKIQNKTLVLIEQRASSDKKVKDVPFKKYRWDEIKKFIDQQNGDSEIGEFIRQSFLELLIHLKVDRKLIGDRLAWRCELCGFETIGQAIGSHKRKHERDKDSIAFFENLNSKSRSVFESKIAAYEDCFKELKTNLNSIEKIEKSNFARRQDFTCLLLKHLPKESWLYFLNQVKDKFSNAAYIDYRKELENQLIHEKIELINEPTYIRATYTNILKYRYDIL